VRADRKKEFLNLHIWGKPRTEEEKQHNRATLELAKRIRNEREQTLKNDVNGYRLPPKNVNFIDYYNAYCDNYTKKDGANIRSSLKRFCRFLKDKYPLYQKSLKAQQLNKDMMMGFVDYLQRTSKGGGAVGAYRRFKKVINYAVEHGVITKNPCIGVVCRADKQALLKDVLSIEEMQQLISTNYLELNPNIRRAFIFCLYTGIRYCDVKELVYADVDTANRLLKFEQHKTRTHSSASGVVIPLNDGLLSLIGKPTTNVLQTEKIFELPHANACLKALRHWTKRAGISKHITWHCARHSFAVNILNNGANIKTVASLLGHSGLKHTEKYTRAVDSLKEAAIK
jgi:site-specific recombinase XerD